MNVDLSYLGESDLFYLTVTLLPNLYMYRHSIELYLTSLIVITHKKLKLNYKDGTIPFDSETPYVLVKEDKWRKMSNCHYISVLYKYFKQLIINYETSLKKEASQGLSAIINPAHQRIVDHIGEYDDHSTYFRYSDFSSSNQNQKDKESKKHYKRKIDLRDLEAHIDDDKPSSIFLVLNSKSGEAIEVHKSVKDMPLYKLAKDLRGFGEYLSGIHVMFRIALCDGY